MATFSVLKKLSLNKKETKRYNKIMEAESPCKDIQPVSIDEIQKNEAKIKELGRNQFGDK